MYDTRVDNRKLTQHLLHLQHLATENNMMWIVFIAHNINKAVYSQYYNLVYVYNLNLFFFLYGNILFILLIILYSLCLRTFIYVYTCNFFIISEYNE